MKLAFVFPGQGSQSLGMLAELSESFPSFLDVFNEASDALGYDLWGLVQNGPEEELNKTEKTQAAMLAADVAVFRLIQQEKQRPADWMAGHSLGEYAALVAANALPLSAAAKLVSTRGRLMQATVPLGLGAMAAIIGLSDAAVQEICLQATSTDEQVMPANFNAIGQVVIAGHLSAVTRALALAEAQAARMAKLIPVSVPCHCALLKEAAEAFAEHLANAPFRLPNCAVISNVDLSTYQSVDQIRTLLKEQLVSPVRWVETIQLLQSQGASHIIESGPGKVLSGLIKRIDKSLTVTCVQDKLSLEQVLV